VVSNRAIEALVPRSSVLEGKVALIVGASRGLGAAITRALALQGCAVWASFARCEAEANELKKSLAGAPGDVTLFQGDAGDLDLCRALERRISDEHGKLDFLVCNACPAPLPLWIEPGAARRLNEYVSRSLALVSVPMAVFLGHLSGGSGWNVVISSVFVQEPPEEWPHYVSAKCAIEGLVRVAAVEYQAVSSLLVRPPRLATDMTNTVLGRKGAIPPERIAVGIVERLAGPKRPGCVEVLEEFPPEPDHQRHP
jgi:NAD(P)-dependent dehydrogenase (short-subunit alcohol dehydrogenase family)